MNEKKWRELHQNELAREEEERVQYNPPEEEKVSVWCLD